MIHYEALNAAAASHIQQSISTLTLFLLHPAAELCSVCVFTVNEKIKGLLKNSVPLLRFDVHFCADAVFGRWTTSYRAGGGCYIWTENLVKHLISFKVSIKSRRHHDAAVPPAQCHFVGQCGICRRLWSQQQFRNLKWGWACASSCPSFGKDSRTPSNTGHESSCFCQVHCMPGSNLQTYFDIFGVDFDGKSVGWDVSFRTDRNHRCFF